MACFENRISSAGIHYSRYIASWYRSGGDFGHPTVDGFIKWLVSTGLSQDEAYDIWYLATNGKLELEESARKYLENDEEAHGNRKARLRKKYAKR